MDFAEWKRLIQSPEESDRSEAADVLPEGGEKSEIIDLLVRALGDEEPLVRASAAETLGLVDADEVRSALRSALKNEEDELARGYVVSALGEVGKLSDLKLIVDEALDERVAAWGKLHCAIGIAVVAVDYAVTSVMATIKDSDLKLGAPAFSALDSIADLLVTRADYIASFAKEWEAKGRSGIEKGAIESILKRAKTGGDR